MYFPTAVLSHPWTFKYSSGFSLTHNYLPNPSQDSFILFPTDLICNEIVDSPPHQLSNGFLMGFSDTFPSDPPTQHINISLTARKQVT